MLCCVKEQDLVMKRWGVIERLFSQIGLGGGFIWRWENIFRNLLLKYRRELMSILKKVESMEIKKRNKYKNY